MTTRSSTNSLGLGIHENSINGTWIAELLSCNTSKSGDEQISLKEYVDRMKEGQKDILLHHRREHRRRVLFSVHGKIVQERSSGASHGGPLDENAVQQLKEFDGKKLKSTTVE